MQDYSIFAIAHRYKDRSVTQLLYTPNGATRRKLAAQHGETLRTIDETSDAGVSSGYQRGTELRERSQDVVLKSVRIPGTGKKREGGHGNEYVTYLVDSVLLVHGVQMTLRTERRYKHFNLLDTLLRKDFGPLVPHALPAKRAFGNLQPSFVEERRVALEKYLQQCVAIPSLAASSLFCNFVEVCLAGPCPCGVWQQAEQAILTTFFVTQADVKDSGSNFEDGEEMLDRSLHRVCKKQGHLLKRGRRVPSWKRRYFCLCGTELFYYYTAEMSNPFQPLGVISTRELTQERDAAAKHGSDSTPDALETSSPPPAHSALSTPSVLPSRPQSSASLVAAPSVIIQPHCSGDASLPALFSFAVHTSSRTWYLAADSQRERDDWVAVLCAAGAQLSASSATVVPSPPEDEQQGMPPPPPLSPPAIKLGGAALPSTAEQSEAAGANAASTADGVDSGAGMRGTLWKRASKVHIAQRSEAETGQARDWVARHFCLREDGTLVYYQSAAEPGAHARGIVPLWHYTHVEAASVCALPRCLLPYLPTIYLHARTLCTPLCALSFNLLSMPPTLRIHRWHQPLPRLPQAPQENLPFAFRLTSHDGGSDSATSSSAIVFAASSADERTEWMSQLTTAVANAASLRPAPTTPAQSPQPLPYRPQKPHHRNHHPQQQPQPQPQPPKPTPTPQPTPPQPQQQQPTIASEEATALVPQLAAVAIADSPQRTSPHRPQK